MLMSFLDTEERERLMDETFFLQGIQGTQKKYKSNGLLKSSTTVFHKISANTSLFLEYRPANVSVGIESRLLTSTVVCLYV